MLELIVKGFEPAFHLGNDHAAQPLFRVVSGKLESILPRVPLQETKGIITRTQVSGTSSCVPRPSSRFSNS